MGNDQIDRAREHMDAAWLIDDADGIWRHLADDTWVQTRGMWNSSLPPAGT